MYVCLCNAVTDTDILDAVKNGAQDISDLARTLGAGTGCGTCQEYTQALIDSATHRSKADAISYAA